MSDVSFSMNSDDEEFVSCRICLMNFDEKERVPKYLEKCHHFFCLPCIKDLFRHDKEKVSCPTCRSWSKLSEKCENLATNHVALHLLKVIETNAIKETVERQRVSDAVIASTPDILFIDCQENQNETLEYPDAVKEKSLTLNSLNQLVLSFAGWLRSEFRGEQLVKLFNENEKNIQTFDMNPSDLETWIKSLNDLNLETPTSQSSLKFGVKMSEFLLTLLSGELHNTESSDSTVSNSSNSSKKSSGNNQCNGDMKKDPERYPENYEPLRILASCSGTQQIFKRKAQDEPEGASHFKKSRGPLSTEIDVITNMEKKILLPKLCQKLCYFKLKINGDVIRHVIFEMNEEMAPVMTAKFLELCSGTLAPPGYSGSKVFPTLFHSYELKSIPAIRGGQITEHENFLFIADVSSVPAKRGSILFTVQEENYWGTLVSPDFQILMSDVDPQRDTTRVNTIFGHVVFGFDVLDWIFEVQKTNVNAGIPIEDFVTIVDCGVYN